MSDQRAHQRLAHITQQLTGPSSTHGLIPISTSSTTTSPSKTTATSTSPKSVQLHGGIMAARALQEQGVKTVFTLTGGHIAPILVGCNQQGIRVIDVRDEATTVFAADAVARLTGIPGVAIVTAGPGLTNTITAVKNAQMAQSPVIVCAGATAMILKGRGSLQDIDQFALMKPHVKSMQTITAVKEIIPAFRRAFRIAQEGVPGPCFIEFPLETIWAREQIASQILGAKTPTFEFNLPSLMAQAQHIYLTRHIERVFKDAYVMPGAVNLHVIPPQPDVASISAVSRALTISSRPIILVGSQAIRAGQTDDLRAALQTLNVPCYLSGMARGLLGASHPLQMRHKRGNALAKADFVLLLGVHADFRLDYGRHINGKAYFATVNLCPVTLKKNNDVRRPSLRVLGDSIAFIRRLADCTTSSPDRSAWFTTLQTLQEKREKEIDEMAAASARPEVADDNANFLDPIKLCRAIDAALDEKSILIADGGDFVGTASYIVRPRGPLTWLDPGVFGTLGVGGGFAMGAKAVHPDAEVWILFGDGSSGWSLTEFDTYVRNKLPVIAVIGNDACWSQMYRDQIRLLHDPVATELAYTDYHIVAQGFGAKGILVRRESELAGALQQAKTWAKQGHPVIVNALISKSGFREGSISL